MRPVAAGVVRDLGAVCGTVLICAAVGLWGRIAIAEPAANEPDASKLNDAYEALDRAERQIPRDTFDPQAIIEQVGRDPAKLFAWVRDHTYWVPYRGALRASRGVLMDRVGSSLDRSLLLAELLRLSGQEVRLVHRTIDPAAAGQLIAKVRPPPSGWLAAAQAGGPNEPAETQTKEPPAEGDQAYQRAVERVSSESTQLAAALGPAPAADAKAKAIDALRDHWWVQQHGQSGWVDLDPLLPDAAPGVAATGTPAAAPDQTLPVPAVDGTPALPAPLCHEVDVKVVIEKWDNGRLSEATALTHTLRPIDLIDRQIWLDHVPVAWPKNLTSAARPDSKARADAIRATSEWLPVLHIGGGSAQSKAITTAGTLVDRPNLDETAKFGGAVGGMFGALGGGGDEAGGGANAAPKSVLTAEWVEYAIRMPGRPVITLRREVFDLLGPAQRQRGARARARAPDPAIDDAKRLDRGFALSGQTQLLLLPCHPSPQFVASSYARRLLGTRAAVTRALAANRPARSALGQEQLAFGPLWAVAIGRLTLAPSGQDVYLTEPNVLQYRVRFAAVEGSNTPANVELIDFAHNAVAVRAGAARDPFAIRLEQGVADTVAEAMPLEVGRGSTPIANTGWVFGLSEEARPIVIRSAADANTLPANTPDAAARIRRAATAGSAIVVPPAPVKIAGRDRIGWWQVDPSTGDTIGVMDSGFNSSATERAALEERVNGMLDLPFRLTLDEMKGYSRQEFIDMMLRARGLSGIRLLQAFQQANALYEMILAL